MTRPHPAPCCWYGTIGDFLRVLEWTQGRPSHTSIKDARSRRGDSHRLRLNSYRVLLTRGRDGFVAFVPPEPGMRSTYEALLLAGARSLTEAGD